MLRRTLVGCVVLLAGVAEISVSRFLAALAIGRSIRYFGLGLLALRYGDRAIEYIHRNETTVSLAAVLLVAATILLPTWLAMSFSGSGGIGAVSVGSGAAAMILLVSIFGNVLSITIPYRIQPGTMKPTKLPAMAMFVMAARGSYLLRPPSITPGASALSSAKPSGRVNSTWSCSDQG